MLHRVPAAPLRHHTAPNEASVSGGGTTTSTATNEVVEMSPSAVEAPHTSTPPTTTPKDARFSSNTAPNSTNHQPNHNNTMVGVEVAGVSSVVDGESGGASPQAPPRVNKRRAHRDPRILLGANNGFGHMNTCDSHDESSEKRSERVSGGPPDAIAEPGSTLCASPLTGVLKSANSPLLQRSGSLHGHSSTTAPHPTSDPWRSDEAPQPHQQAQEHDVRTSPEPTLSSLPTVPSDIAMGFAQFHGGSHNSPITSAAAMRSHATDPVRPSIPPSIITSAALWSSPSGSADHHPLWDEVSMAMSSVGSEEVLRNLARGMVLGGIDLHGRPQLEQALRSCSSLQPPVAAMKAENSSDEAPASAVSGSPRRHGQYSTHSPAERSATELHYRSPMQHSGRGGRGGAHFADPSLSIPDNTFLASAVEPGMQSLCAASVSPDFIFSRPVGDDHPPHTSPMRARQSYFHEVPAPDHLSVLVPSPATNSPASTPVASECSTASSKRGMALPRYTSTEAGEDGGSRPSSSANMLHMMDGSTASLRSGPSSAYVAGSPLFLSENLSPLAADALTPASPDAQLSGAELISLLRSWCSAGGSQPNSPQSDIANLLAHPQVLHSFSSYGALANSVEETTDPLTVLMSGGVPPAMVPVLPPMDGGEEASRTLSDPSTSSGGGSTFFPICRINADAHASQGGRHARDTPTQGTSINNHSIMQLGTNHSTSGRSSSFSSGSVMMMQPTPHLSTGNFMSEAMGSPRRLRRHVTAASISRLLDEAERQLRRQTTPIVNLLGYGQCRLPVPATPSTGSSVAVSFHSQSSPMLMWGESEAHRSSPSHGQSQDTLTSFDESGCDPSAA